MSAKQKPTTATTKNRAPKPTRPTAPPWIEGGIDYGPALVAIDELIAWAFDLAAASVPDRESKRRVKHARRQVIATFRGKRKDEPDADVMFTAAVLARVLDADLKLGLGEIVTVLAELGLPSDDVPRPPRRSASVPAYAVPRAPSMNVADLAGAIDAIQRGARITPIGSLRRPPPGAAIAPCAGCRYARPGFAVAA